MFRPGECHGQRSLAGAVPGVTQSWSPLRRLSTHARLPTPSFYEWQDGLGLKRPAPEQRWSFQLNKLEFLWTSSPLLLTAVISPAGLLRTEGQHVGNPGPGAPAGPSATPLIIFGSMSQTRSLPRDSARALPPAWSALPPVFPE